MGSVACVLEITVGCGSWIWCDRKKVAAEVCKDCASALLPQTLPGKASHTVQAQGSKGVAHREPQTLIGQGFISRELSSQFLPSVRME